MSWQIFWAIDKRVRFWSIDCILLWAGAFNGRELATTVRLLDDPEKAVRWKAMDFLSRASPQQLASALTWLLKEEPESTDAHGLQWLFNVGNDAGAITALLVSPHPKMRKYAAAAAARVAAKNQHPLSIASASYDTEVAEFAAAGQGFCEAARQTTPVILCNSRTTSSS